MAFWCQEIDLGQLLQNIPFAVQQQTASQGSNFYLQLHQNIIFSEIAGSQLLL